VSIFVKKILRTVIAIALVIGLGLSYEAQPAAAAGGDQPGPLTSKHQHKGNPKLDSELNRQVSTMDSLRAAGQSRASEAAQAANTKVRVIVECLPGQTAAVKQLSRGFGTVETSYSNLQQVMMPIGQLTALANSQSVRLVRTPYKFFPDVVSEGVSVINANQWKTANITGAGVKIGVLDLGFAGYTLRQTYGELPPSITTNWAVSINGTGTEVHGTTCAEIVYDIVPDAQFYFANYNTDVEYNNAVDWMIAQGVQVISHSVGWFNTVT
jgi:hypothetical protein